MRPIPSILRQAEEPPTTCDMALRFLTKRAFESGVRLRRLMTKRVGVALGGRPDNGIARAEQGPGHGTPRRIDRREAAQRDGLLLRDEGLA